MNYFSSYQIQNLLKEHGFCVSYIEQKPPENEFEGCHEKLIVLSNNEKRENLSN